MAPLLADSRVPDAAIQAAPPPPVTGLSGEDFAAVFKSRERARSAHFSLHWRPSPAAASRFGMVVAKRLTRTAIRRNLIKRQARALFALAPQLPPRDVVLRLTANPRELARAQQYAELAQLFAALGAGSRETARDPARAQPPAGQAAKEQA